MRKFIKIVSCLVILSVIMIAAAACVKVNNDDKKNSSTKVNIDYLPDMVDYGNSAYISVPPVDYSAGDIADWTAELQKKQDEERGYWLLDGEKWDDAPYRDFAAIVDGARKHPYGYLAYDEDEQSYYWEDGESANTVERIFCYSDPSAVIDKLSLAGVARDHTNLIVEYISRTGPDEENREKYRGFTFEIGTSSAIDDYSQLEELKEMYDDWTEDEIKENGEFRNSDEVSDAIYLKNRKIYGEIFKIFGNEVDDFARASIAMTEYAVEVIESVMMPIYKEAVNAAKLEFGDDGTYHQYGKNYEEFIAYMRTEMYDYDSLSYLIAFREFTNMSSEYLATDKIAAMTLLGYHYQFKQREYNVFDDSVKVSYDYNEDGKAETITEYKYFLKLSHQDYYDTDKEALDYRTMDRRQYAEAYRYTTSCLTKYYQSQLEFQAIQEDVDAEIYVGKNYNKGISYYGQNTGTEKGTNTVTYSSEMQQALRYGLDANMKIGDVNWEYSADDNRVLRMNYVSKRWNNPSVDQDDPSPTQRLYKVEYEIELLNSQNYVLNHATISDADLVGALRYEIKSYSADSVRGIQQNKKNDVIYGIDIDRMLTALGRTETTLSSNERAAYNDLIENEGRNAAEYYNLGKNYNQTGMNEEIDKAAQADWNGVRSNIATTLAQDYKNYKGDKPVDEYFEDTLIKKKWNCGGEGEVCGDPNSTGSHLGTCEEEYDTDWALSKLLNYHEMTLRYMYGQIEVTLTRLVWEKFTSFAGYTDEESGTKNDTVFNKGTARNGYSDSEGNGAVIVTLMTDEEIGSVLFEYTGDGNINKYKNLPKYDSVTSADKFTITIKGEEYTFEFEGWYVDPELNYKVLDKEEYNYDIRLYPGYSVTKVGT